MGQLRAAVYGMLTSVRDRARDVLALLGVPIPVDPEMEECVRKAFNMLKQSRLFEPSEDLVPAVLDRLQQLQHDHAYGSAPQCEEEKE